MTKFKLLVLSVFLLSFSLFSFAADTVKIKMTTNMGDIILELYPINLKMQDRTLGNYH
ncbi:MAG: hypothetical protein LC437_06540 [Thiohalomonas sp.]|nr:hypothetical protein [Thiohalomonas sp.]